jgi:hypothetical protein
MVFSFRLENEDGAPADPPALKAAVPNWGPGDTIALGPGRMLRVIALGLTKDQAANPFPCSSSRRQARKGH